MIKKYTLICFLLFFCEYSSAQWSFNGDFEKNNPATKKLEGWIFPTSSALVKSYAVVLDSTIKQSGKYAVSIEKIGNELNEALLRYSLAGLFEGNTIELRAYIKTEGVDKESFAGLWLQLDGEDGKMISRNKYYQRVTGTSDWKQYSIELPYRADIKFIHLGGLLSGGGKAWFDNFELRIDGVPIENVKIIRPKNAAVDTAFSKSSRIKPITMTAQVLNNLSVAGQFWGFLKYHHPAITSGDYNWDAELFKFLPEIIKAKNNNELSGALEKYLLNLPDPAICKSCSEVTNKEEILSPNYGDLLNGKILSGALTKKLLFIKNNRSLGENYWIGKAIPGYAIFKNEKAYAQMPYPDLGYRLLALYRYWSMINYYYPYRNLITEDWNKVLLQAIPGFVAAGNQHAYTLEALKLITKINDSHAFTSAPALNTIKGINLSPFRAKFIEDKLIVTGFYVDTLGIKEQLQVGDVIVAINNKKIKDLVQEYLPITPGSNYNAQLRDLPEAYLLRSNQSTLKIELQRAGHDFQLEVPTIPLKFMTKKTDARNGFYLINESIGYINPAKYKNTELPAIKKEFEKTKGMIIDLRNYPSEPMWNTLAAYIKPQESPFVKGSAMNLRKPGSFVIQPPRSNGNSKENTDRYPGKVVIIANESSQSQSEFTIMAFQSSPNVAVVGSQTAGADGDLSSLVLPGGIKTNISGIGIYYPNSEPTQRVGVKIDYVIKPTINGIALGRDELLEKAISLVEK